MPRPTDGPTARDVKLSLRVTESTSAALDRQRGQLTRSEYVRRLIVRDGRVRTAEKSD